MSEQLVDLSAGKRKPLRDRGPIVSVVTASVGAVFGVILTLASLAFDPAIEGAPWPLELDPWGVVFPFSFFFGFMERTLFICLMFLQYPIYGLILGSAFRRRWLLIVSLTLFFIQISVGTISRGYLG